MFDFGAKVTPITSGTVPLKPYSARSGVGYRAVVPLRGKAHAQAYATPEYINFLSNVRVATGITQDMIAGKYLKLSIMFCFGPTQTLRDNAVKSFFHGTTPDSDNVYKAFVDGMYYYDDKYTDVIQDDKVRDELLKLGEIKANDSMIVWNEVVKINSNEDKIVFKLEEVEYQI